MYQEWAPRSADRALKRHCVRITSCRPRQLLRGPFFLDEEGAGRLIERPEHIPLTAGSPRMLGTILG